MKVLTSLIKLLMSMTRTLAPVLAAALVVLEGEPNILKAAGAVIMTIFAADVGKLLFVAIEDETWWQRVLIRFLIFFLAYKLAPLFLALSFRESAMTALGVAVLWII